MTSYKRISLSKLNYITIVVRCAIWYHLYNLENVKNTHGGVLVLVKLQVSAQIAQRITIVKDKFRSVFRALLCIYNDHISMVKIHLLK